MHARTDYQAEGTLTIRDKTHPISFKTTWDTGEQTHLKADFTIDRTDCGVKYNSEDDFKLGKLTKTVKMIW